MTVAGPALAQSTGSTADQQSTQTAAPAAGQQNLAAAQKIKQDLQSAGFQDVNVVAESFVVQAKTKDGNPVVMTIGPHGMSVFEAMNIGKAGSNSTANAAGNGKTTQQ
jgi:hypothetical protein